MDPRGSNIPFVGRDGTRGRSGRSEGFKLLLRFRFLGLGLLQVIRKLGDLLVQLLQLLLKFGPPTFGVRPSFCKRFPLPLGLVDTLACLLELVNGRSKKLPNLVELVFDGP